MEAILLSNIRPVGESIRPQFPCYNRLVYLRVAHCPICYSHVSFGADKPVGAPVYSMLLDIGNTRGHF